MPIGTPYCTPAMLLNAPTGASWEIVPEPGADSEARLAELTNIAWRATSVVDTYCQQELRATVDTEELTGPGQRVGLVPGTDIARLVMKRWPVTQILAVQTSSIRSFPRAWSLVPSGMYDVEHPLINSLTDTASATTPDGGWSIQVAPGYIPPWWQCGRNSTRVMVSYTNGWPHTSLTQAATQGATVLHVDDVTGFAGANAFVYDGATTEPVSVLSAAATTPLQLPNGAGTAQTGPGTITLASGLSNPHGAGVVVSSLPANVLWATACAAASQVLEAGITSISIANVQGATSEGGKGVEDLITEYEVLLQPFRRIA